MTTATVAGIQPNEAQRIRDGSPLLRDACAACGHRSTGRNPLVLAGDGYRVHARHLVTPGDGYYGMPFTEAS